MLENYKNHTPFDSVGDLSQLKLVDYAYKGTATSTKEKYQDVIDENNARVIGNRNYYKLRQQIIEHQFGILKRQWGFTYTLMKGKKED